MRRPSAVAAAAVALVGVSVPVAHAAWTTSGSAAATAAARTLSAPGTPVAGTTTQTSVPISWSAAAAMPTGTLGYWVQRAPAGTTSWSPACGSTEAAPLSATSCTDTGLAAGASYEYRVTSVYQAWRAVSGTSGVVTTKPAVVDEYSVELVGVGSGRNAWTATVEVTIRKGTTPLAGYAVSGSWANRPLTGTPPTGCTTGSDGSCSFTADVDGPGGDPQPVYTITSVVNTGGSTLAESPTSDRTVTVPKGGSAQGTR